MSCFEGKGCKIEGILIFSTSAFTKYHTLPKFNHFHEIKDSHNLHIDLSKESSLFVTLKSFVLVSSISGTKRCQNRRISSVYLKNKDDI